MKVIKGNLLKLAEDGHFDVIVHGCNCFTTMAGGIARQIKQRFPQAYIADCATVSGDKNKLGTCTISMGKSDKGNNFFIVNAYTQFGFSSPGNCQFRYSAAGKAMRTVASVAKGNFIYPRIGYPKIGAGLGGANWDTVYKIIQRELKDLDHTLVEFDG